MSTKLIFKQIIKSIHIFNKRHEEIKTKEIQNNNYTVKTVTSQSKKEQLHIRNNLRTIGISLPETITY